MNQSDFQNATQITAKLLRAGEVAKILNISTSLAYKLLQAGAIPTVRINRSVRVKSTDLEEYINRSWSGWKE